MALSTLANRRPVFQEWMVCRTQGMSDFKGGVPDVAVGCAQTCRARSDDQYIDLIHIWLHEAEPPSFQ